MGEPTAVGSAAVILSASVDIQNSFGTPEFVTSWIRQRVTLELLSCGHLNIIGQKPAWTIKVGCLDLPDSISQHRAVAVKVAGSPIYSKDRHPPAQYRVWTRLLLYLCIRARGRLRGMEHQAHRALHASGDHP